MKRLFNFALVLCLGLTCLTSCDRQDGTAVPISGTNLPKSAQNNYQVKFLFETEGVRVYRFNDNGDYIYFTDHPGTVTKVHTEMDDDGSRTIKTTTNCN